MQSHLLLLQLSLEVLFGHLLSFLFPTCFASTQSGFLVSDGFLDVVDQLGSLLLYGHVLEAFDVSLAFVLFLLEEQLSTHQSILASCYLLVTDLGFLQIVNLTHHVLGHFKVREELVNLLADTIINEANWFARRVFMSPRHIFIRQLHACLEGLLDSRDFARTFNRHRLLNKVILLLRLKLKLLE